MKSARRKLKGRVLNPVEEFFNSFSKESEIASSTVGPTGIVPQVSSDATQEAASTTSPAEDALDMTGAVDEAHGAISSRRLLGEHAQDAMEAAEPVADAVKSTSELLQPVLEKVEVFTILVETIGDIHPYAKIASTVLLAGVKVVINQDKRDKAIDGLLEAMDNIYNFANRALQLGDIDKDRKKLLKDMTLQTTQCAYFIRDQAQVKNFWLRAGRNAILGSQIDNKIDEFTEAFCELLRRFNARGVLEGEFRLVTLLDISQDMNANIELLNLAHVRGAGLNPSKGCLEGTRRKTLDELIGWINNPVAPQVCFLLGGAGTGKSSIAHSIGKYFQDLRRLGAFFCFDRSFQGDRHPETVFSTIAHNLANWNPDFRRALTEVLRDQRDLADSKDITAQWEGLIIEPFKRFLPLGPVLIVIDAFDESSDPRSRHLLLEHLTEGSTNLPANIRILITSRPEHYIMRVVGHSQDAHLHISHVSLDHKEEATSDIELYVRHELVPDDSLSDEALDDADIRLLVTKAEGLFQWAATACRVVLQNPAGLTLRERFNLRLGAVLGGGASSLDNLYQTILDQLFTLDEPVLAERFRSVMAQMLCASSPLSIASLDEMRRLATGRNRDEVTLVVQYMGPLLSGVSNRTSPILPLHTSFRDFLTNEGRSKEWFVDLAKGHPIMALGCFRVMNNGLSFNICRLETSYILNCEVPDLESRLNTFVPQSLSYASCSWKDHLNITHSSDLQQELSKFLRERLLFWFELLSLLKSVNRAAPSLEAALKEYDDSGRDSSKALLVDAISFIRRFAGVIAQAAPHIYISALPFSPTSSRVQKSYIPSFPFLPLVDGVCDRWPQAHAVLSEHTDFVHSVAYSPDGRHIVSGSDDKTVRVWDAETGEATYELSCGSMVLEVAFSPDGRHIAAALADSMVRIWDSTTGEAVGEPLRGHEGAVWCVAYSPDGRRIVSGDERGRICIWSTETLGMVYKPIPGHASNVNCVAFSPTSQYIASGSDDKTVRVWDAVEGRAVGKPYEGHTLTISSVIFSLDGLRIVSGSWDSTIRIWDFNTQRTLHMISHHLQDGVWSLSLSPDGRRIVSGSENGSILIWDVETYGIVGGPFVGHTRDVCAVRFSPDGRHVVSGSNDATLRIWSAEESTSTESPGNVSSDPSDSAPTSSVASVAYSPDGRWILSGSEDGTINVWDADTGKSIGRHLKGHSEDITRVRFSPDGGHFVSASLDFTLRVWDSTTLQAVGEPLLGHADWVLDADYSPDGCRIVSCSIDRTIRIWDAATYECLLGPLDGHASEGWVRSVAWSPDGKHIASGWGYGTVRVWDAETGHAVGEPFKGHEGWVLSVSWSIDSRCVLSSGDDGKIRFWDTEKWEEAGEPLRGHTGSVYNAMYSPDCRRIMSTGRDGTIRMWDAQTRQSVGESLSNPFGRIDCLALSPDGRRIVSGSQTSLRIIVWDVNAFTDPSGAHPPFVNYNAMSTSSFEGPSELSTPPEFKRWNGWITDKNGNRVMWVPDEYRDSLLWRGMVKVMGRESLTIDFSDAFSGTEWARCYKAQTPP